MPVVNIQMFEGRDEAKPAIAEAVTYAIADHAGIDPRFVYVLFSDVSTDNWAIAGEMYSATLKKTEQGKE
ncbi:TPA: 4-oxalocrotonate tautomerase family protein [Serratia fonticola]|nr:4-oxalocrotonate tautomerase family protein [Serratia fonticola]